ncbi:hypothetical protein RUND412_005421 [Rhizina undulata]
MASTPRLVVCGGNGFLGSRICKSAVTRGWSVTSISRSGEPKWETLGEKSAPEWSKSVNWHRGNILEPNSYRDELNGATAVVHSMGILLEADYKGVLSGKEPIIGGLKKAFDSTQGAGSNAGRLREEGQKVGLNYESMNRDSAITLVEEALSHKANTFLYVSAADGSFLLPHRYIATKREAEEKIAEIGSRAETAMRNIFLRPGFLYDSTRPVTMPLAGIIGITSTVNSLFGGKLPLLGAAGYKPLKAEVVAEAAVQAIADEHVKGVVDVRKIDELATKAWRQGML